MAGSFSQPMAAAGGSGVAPRNCCPAPRSRSLAISRAWRARLCSSEVSARTASTGPPNRMNPPTPISSPRSMASRYPSHPFSVLQRTAGSSSRATFKPS